MAFFLSYSVGFSHRTLPLAPCPSAEQAAVTSGTRRDIHGCDRFGASARHHQQRGASEVAELEPFLQQSL